MRRLPNHDYRSPCTYHITLNKPPDIPDFSVITGCPESWYVYHTVTGKAIEKSINEISTVNPRIKVYRYTIMPDHVHILLKVLEYLDKSVGTDIGKMKTRSLQKVREKGLSFESLFVRDFHDRIVWPGQSLDTVFQYVKQNPYRLLVRKFYPDYFKRINNLFNYRGIFWQAYGNMQLLDNPFKNAVVCHRAEEKIAAKAEANRNRWYHTAENGGVLVSPFIAAPEKEIRSKAEELDGKIILVVNEPFGKIFKPWGHDFEQCEKGRLLIIAPDRPLAEGRSTWVFLNGLAEWISGWWKDEQAL